MGVLRSHLQLAKRLTALQAGWSHTSRQFAGIQQCGHLLQAFSSQATLNLEKRTKQRTWYSIHSALGVPLVNARRADAAPCIDMRRGTRRCMSSQAGGMVVTFPLAQTGEGISECELMQWFVKVMAPCGVAGSKQRMHCSHVCLVLSPCSLAGRFMSLAPALWLTYRREMQWSRSSRCVRCRATRRPLR